MAQKRSWMIQTVDNWRIPVFLAISRIDRCICGARSESWLNTRYRL